MKCPVCDRELEEVKVGDLAVDVCKGGCGGMWFDNFELKKVDEQHEGAGEELLDIESDVNVVVDLSRKRTCPKCSDQKMMKHFASVKHKVEVDECPSCAGIWLDRGELAEIRKQYATEEERKEAAMAYFEETVGPELERMKAESEEGLRKARRFAKMFRFVCPTYYIPGKQEWGAF